MSKKYKRYCSGELELVDKEPYPIWLSPIPNLFYKGKGWKSWPHFLTGKEKIFWSFKKCREHLINLNVLKSSHDFQKYRKGTFKGLPKAPDGIPSRPDETYKTDWKSWPHLLGYEKLSFEEAKRIVRKQKFKTINAFRNWSDRPSNMPSHPEREYGDEKGWKGIQYFLGITDFVPVNRNKIRFLDAQKFCRKLKLSSLKEWRLYVAGRLDGYENKPSNIPSQLHTYYKNKGWISYSDFLGYKSKEKKKKN